MKCIIGLGNIGNEYNNTRHNMGFMCLDYFAQKMNVEFTKKLKKCIYAECTINGEKVIIAKPTTFMNLSGEAVVELMNWFKLQLEDICVIYDDVDLPFGSVRYREKGSSGTHNGMRNILQLVGNQNLKRIRVGIEQRDENSRIELYDFVLSKYSKNDLEKIEKEICPIVKENIDNFLTK
ncbi:MAG: aminoacyl-tRNA hydrolase [Clostridia bacterium]|nr:aminoacyl-tRNA hydrolase [Clostridia bacterium]